VQTFLDEILQQPAALHAVLDAYDTPMLESIRAHIKGKPLLFTGMGASYNACEIGTYCFQSKHYSALAHQAVDLLNYPYSISPDHILFYVSQSGESAEVAPLLETRRNGRETFGITNHPESTLARLATLTLLLAAGQEETVATKTYLNTLALIHLISGTPHDALYNVSEHIQRLLQASEQTRNLWQQAIVSPDMLYIVGHGPHAVTARQAAMMCAEWLKRPAIGMSIGALRHGFIEAIQPSSTVIIFAPWGATRGSALALGDQLSTYGTNVLIIEHGQTRRVSEAAHEPLADDEFLAPLLDIIPAQLAIEAATRISGMAQGFRYISKIVSQL
jgi:glucosamine--fructose-6-phosphate aminotransferase (isomerizing)